MQTAAVKIEEIETQIKVEKYKKVKELAYQGNASAQYTFGIWHSKLSDLKDEENPTQWFLKAALQGQRSAQYELGRNLIHGIGCEIDKVKGIDWLTRSAANGEQQAVELLATIFAANSSRESQMKATNLMKNLKVMSASSKIRFAWLLATSPYKEVSDPELAIDLVDSISWKDFNDEVTKQEIIAAAHAALGDYEEAIDYQKDALKDAKKLGFDVSEIEQRLTEYRGQYKNFH